MEGFTERQITTINTINNRIQGHKAFLMSKVRARYSFKDIVEAKLAELYPKIYKQALPCEGWQKREAYYRNVGEYEHIDADFMPFNVGDKWGGPDVTCFLKNEIVIPDELDGKKVDVQLYVGGDSLVKVNGKPVQGLDPFRNSFVLTEKATAGEKYLVEVESFCFYAGPNEGLNKRTFECSALTEIDREVNDIYWDLKVALNLLDMKDIPAELTEYIEKVFHDIINYIDLDIEDYNVFIEKLRKAKAIVKERIYEGGKFRQAGLVDLVGHSHLDILYMWDYKEFIRKTGRTHATMLSLLDEYPEFRFCQSQAVTYKEIKEHYPDVYARIKEYVKEGRWEIIGGLWVECDCNLPSGESFVRQLLEGRKFFQKEFGVTPKTAWLPDVFGNSYGMPQILAKSGIEYFVTHKPSVWNDTNPVPHHTFWWKGADGSKVLAVLSPSHFVGTCEPNHVKLNWDKFSDKTSVGESMYCYGWGDGGGGVSPDMIENAKRMQHIVGMPDTRIINAEDSLASICERAKKTDLPVLQNEIYLEAHRAVGTIRTDIKRYNRTCERLLHDVELYSVMAEKYGYKYDAEKLEEFSRRMLTNQFHDTLPGTFVGDAHKYVVAEYEKIIALGESLKQEALEVLLANVQYDSSKGEPIIVFNPLAYEASLMTDIDKLYTVTDSDGKKVDVQAVKGLDGKESVKFLAENIPTFGYKAFYLSAYEKNEKVCATVSANALENKFFKIAFDKQGELVSIYDKKNDRELLKGASNSFRLYDDNPSSHDAWDVASEYKEFTIDISGTEIVPFENGPVQASVLLKKKFLGSTIEQKIIVYDKIARIDFETRADWHETKKMLRTEFDFDLVTSKYTSNLAYASLERPTNAYNSYDMAKFEICAQDFVDMSEEGYGVSILSDVKSNYGVNDTTISLSLLRGPVNPDRNMDRGINEFTYSIYPHVGTWKNGSVQAFGASVNKGVAYKPVKVGEFASEFIQCDKENVFIEAIKKSEDGEGIIVRVLEKYGYRTNISMQIANGVKKVAECNLIEEYIQDVPSNENCFDFTIKPYEIKTFKIV